jgi:hypothetical protein
MVRRETEVNPMDGFDVDADFELLMRHWHVTTDFAAAAWADYLALRESLPPSSPHVIQAHARWRVAERERRELLRAIERLEETEAA